MKVNWNNIILGFIGFSFLGLMVWGAFSPQKSPQTIEFKVTGIINGTEASTLTTLHFECIKYCIQHVSAGYIDKCYEQCKELGQEACG